MKENSQYFDLSDYTREHIRNDDNKQELGCFKDELNGRVMP